MNVTEDNTNAAARQKLLIVDDDRNWTDALRLFFLDKYSVEVVNSAADALEKIRLNEPDAIIVDLVMPMMDGFGLMRRLSDGNAHIPIILLTGWKTAEVEQCATSFGCAAVLAKPVEPQVLEEVVSTVVGSNRVRPAIVT
ncbi:MAG TPA: response regulator [Blastocatellia bacterium]|nr:response regulator [Blastocatellia bacterium]